MATSTKTFNKPKSASLFARKKFSSGISLRYPLEEDYTVYMQYRIKEIIPAATSAGRSLITAFKATADDKLKKVNSTAALQNRRGFTPGGASDDVLAMQEYDGSSLGDPKSEDDADPSVSKGLLGFRTKYADTSAIKLYMPQALQIADTVNYDAVDLGLAGGAGLTAMNEGGGLLNAVGSALGEQAKSFGQLFGLGSAMGITATAEAARVATARAAAKLPADMRNAANIALQVKVNPNTRSTFTGVGVRNFSFTYEFIPTSQQEAETVQKIIRRFREELYPQAIPQEAFEAGFPLGYEFPNLFEIKFMHGSKDLPIPQPLLSYLRGVNVTYNPTSASFHRDGQPNAIQMSLNFQEFRSMNKQDVMAGN